MNISYVKTGLAMLLIAGLAACSGSSSGYQGSFTPQTSIAPDKGGTGKPGQRVSVSPTSLTFSEQTAAAQTFVASENFAGTITAVSANTSVATVNPPSARAKNTPKKGGLKHATFTVTPVAIGTTAIVVTDKKHHTATVTVTVLAPAGNIFVSDQASNTVNEMLASNAYAALVLLGSGFSKPQRIALDGNGNVFVADSANNAVKEILAASGYTTVNTLGSGFINPVAVAVDHAGNVFVVDNNGIAANDVSEMFAVGGVIPPVPTIVNIGTGFNGPTAIAVDASANLFIADTGNNTVKEVLASGGYTTIDTLGSGFTMPEGIGLDSSGNVYVGSGDGTIKEILAASGYVTVNTLATGFKGPQQIAVDTLGNVYVADTGFANVKEILAVGGVIPVSPAILNVGPTLVQPAGIAIQNSSVPPLIRRSHRALR